MQEFGLLWIVVWIRQVCGTFSKQWMRNWESNIKHASIFSLSSLIQFYYQRLGIRFIYKDHFTDVWNINNYANASKERASFFCFVFFIENWSFFIISHRSLKSFVTPMIAGLLESNQKIRWTFDKYFNSTNDIMNKITVKVFDCSTGINNKLYIDKTDRYVCHDAIHLFWRKKRWL